MNLLVSSSLQLVLLLSTVNAGNPVWQTLRNHLQARPNLSRQLKPTPEHYGYSELDYGGNHPFERRRLADELLLGHETLDYSGANGEYDMLRLRFLTEPLTSRLGQSPALDATIQAILDEVLPAVQRTWMSHLDVVPVQGSLPIQRSDCFGIYENLVPNSVLENGVDEADLVVFVSGEDFVTTEDGERVEVCGPGVLAVATSCVLDQFDRPIIGLINFCLGEQDRRLEEEEHSNLPKVLMSNLILESNVEREQFTAEDKAVADLSLIATHEVGHVLGVTSELFLFFRDPTTGEPLTPRPFQEKIVTCVNGSSLPLIFPAENTVQASFSSQGRLYYDLVTPRIRTVVRNQFDCQTLSGARLENNPTSESCTGDHFDERLFYSELMGPIFSGTTDILSPLTLALLEDSGWYKVHYEGAEASPFGLGAGCAFVNDDCIINDEVPDYATGAFCTDVTQIDSFTGKISDDNNLLCDPTHRSVGFCDLFDRSDASTSVFDFDNGIQYFSDSSLQALSAQNDWCPVAAIPSGVDCTDDSGPKMQQSYAGEVYGATSKCLNIEPDSVLQFSVPGCFNIQCDAANRQVIVNGVTCEFDGQRIPTTNIVTGSVANMICPKLAVVCPALFCQGGCSGRGVCNFSSNECECFDLENTSPICSDMVGTGQGLSSASSLAPLVTLLLGLVAFIML
jgi:leishmanolysin-like peptidase